MAFWVYMLRCSDQSYYIGHTDDLEKRVSEHESGELGGYTGTHQLVVRCESFSPKTFLHARKPLLPSSKSKDGAARKSRR